MTSTVNGNNFNNTIEQYLEPLENEHVTAGISLFLILYTAVIAPKLPPHIIKWFDNWLVQVALFFAIVYISNKNVTVALIAAVAVLVTMMIASNQQIIRDVVGRSEEHPVIRKSKEILGRIGNRDSKIGYMIRDVVGRSEAHPVIRKSKEILDMIGSRDSKAGYMTKKNCGCGHRECNDNNEEQLSIHMMKVDGEVEGLMDADIEELHTERAGINHIVPGGAHTSHGGPKMQSEMEPDYPDHSKTGKLNDSNNVSGVDQHEMDNIDSCGSSIDPSNKPSIDSASSMCAGFAGVNHVNNMITTVKGAMNAHIK